MAFNTLEYLEAGKVDFVYRLTTYDNGSLINSIRNSERKDYIIKGFLPKLIKRLPHFCFQVIYDNPSFQEEAWYALNKCYSIENLPKETLIKVLYNTTYGIRYFKKNYTKILDIYYNDFTFVLDYMFNNYDSFKTKLKELSITKDMHIRFLFMSHLITSKSYLFKKYYPSLSKYLIDNNYKKNEQLSFLPTLMSASDISKLAFDIFESPLKEELYPEIKDFIANNYEKNEIAYHLTQLKKESLLAYGTQAKMYKLVDNEDGIKEFNNDPDWYFSTTKKGKVFIYQNYSASISKELLDNYAKFLSYFEKKNGEYGDRFSNIDFHGLSSDLEYYVTKYLDLSKSREHHFIEGGSTADVFRIGDYVFKLDYTKWSFENDICPDLYIILPNLEEVFVRDNRGIVKAGIEVQKYLVRDAKNIPDEIWKKFRNELSRLGYYTTDTLMDGPCGDNCRLLDDYKESGNLKPPKWFKKYPIVIVDRDRIYERNNIYPKQLRSRY